MRLPGLTDDTSQNIVDVHAARSRSGGGSRFLRRAFTLDIGEDLGKKIVGGERLTVIARGPTAKRVQGLLWDRLGRQDSGRHREEIVHLPLNLVAGEWSRQNVLSAILQCVSPRIVSLVSRHEDEEERRPQTGSGAKLGDGITDGGLREHRRDDDDFGFEMGTRLYSRVQIAGNLEAVAPSGDGISNTIDRTLLVLDE